MGTMVADRCYCRDVGFSGDELHCITDFWLEIRIVLGGIPCHSEPGSFHWKYNRHAPQAHVDIGSGKIMVENQTVDLSASLLSADGKRMSVGPLSSLMRREGSFACLNLPEVARGQEYVGFEARASQPITLLQVLWVSTDKL